MCLLNYLLTYLLYMRSALWGTAWISDVIGSSATMTYMYIGDDVADSAEVSVRNIAGEVSRSLMGVTRACQPVIYGEELIRRP